MIDRADDGVGATRQGCYGNEHQREFTHLTNIAARTGASPHKGAIEAVKAMTEQKWSRL
jgi:hypothetical protein